MTISVDKRNAVSICLYVSLLLSVCLFVCLPVRLSLSLSLSLYLYMSITRLQKWMSVGEVIWGVYKFYSSVSFPFLFQQYWIRHLNILSISHKASCNHQKHAFLVINIFTYHNKNVYLLYHLLTNPKAWVKYCSRFAIWLTYTCLVMCLQSILMYS